MVSSGTQASNFLFDYLRISRAENFRPNMAARAPAIMSMFQRSNRRKQKASEAYTFLYKELLSKSSQHFCIHLIGHTGLPGMLGNSHISLPSLRNLGQVVFILMAICSVKIQSYKQKEKELLGGNCLPCVLYINICEYFSFSIVYI